MSGGSPGGGRIDRWQHLVHAAFLLEEGTGDALKRARNCLDTVLEVFPSSLDPIEDFEGYSVRRLALALRRTLSEKTGET